MLQQLGGLHLEVTILPFEPEVGAYRQGANHTHG
jgi:urease accessory protein UreE